jgi:hypothetical protein
MVPGFFLYLLFATLWATVDSTGALFPSRLKPTVGILSGWIQQEITYWAYLDNERLIDYTAEWPVQGHVGLWTLLSYGTAFIVQILKLTPMGESWGPESRIRSKFRLSPE